MVDNNNARGSSLISAKLITVILAALICLAFMPLLGDEAMAASKKPAKVKGLSVSISAENNVSIKWKKAKKAKKYEVNITDNTSKLVATKKVKSKKYSFKGQGKTKYTIKVRALNGKKKGKWSSKKTATTNAGAEEAAAKKSADEASKKAKDAEAAAAAAEQKQKETADELAKTAAAALQDHKDAAETVLRMSAAPKDYDDDAWLQVQDILDKAEEAIANAKDSDEVDAILAQAGNDIAEIPTVLDNAKISAAEYLENMVDPEDYPEMVRQEIADIIETAKYTVMFADDLIEVQAAVEIAENAIAEIPSTLDECKEYAIDTLEAYEDSKADYEKADWADIKEIIENAEVAILAAETVDEVGEILETAVDMIEEFPTILETAQEDAIAALEVYRASKDEYTAEDWLEMEGIIDGAEDLIMDAETPDDVDEILEAALDELYEYQTKLETAQEEAIDTLEAYREYQDEYERADWLEIKEIIENAEADILAAETVDEVGEILETAVDAIEEFPTILETAQLDALATLAEYEELESAYDPEDWEEIEGIIAIAKLAVMGAEDEGEIDEILAQTATEIAQYPTNLESAQEAAIEELAAYYEYEDQYAEEDWEDIEALIGLGTLSIMQADSVPEVEEILEKTEGLIAMYPTILENAQAEAIIELELYADPSDYGEDEQLALKDAIAAGEEAIMEATTIKEVEAALNEAEAAIDEISTLLDEYKEEEMSALLEKYNGDEYDSLDWGTMKKIQEILADTAAAVLNADDYDEVDDAIEYGESRIAGIFKELAAEELAAYIDSDYLAFYSEANAEIVKSIVGLGIVAINSAEDYEEVEAVYGHTVELIVAVPTLLDEAKAAAIDELYDYVDWNAYDPQDEEITKALEAAIEAGENAINEVADFEDVDESFDEVNAALDAAKAAIDEIPTLLDAYKETATTALVEEYSGEKYDDVDWATMKEIMEILSVAATEIEDAKDEAAVDAIVAEAKAEIADLFKAYAVEMLQSFDDEEYLAFYDDEGQNTVKSIITLGVAAITNAADEEEIDAALEEAMGLLDAVPTLLDAAKAEAINELYLYADPTDYDAEELEALNAALEAGEKAINEVPDFVDLDASLEEVNAALEDAEEAIDMIMTNLDKYKAAAIEDLVDRYIENEEYDDLDWATMKEIQERIAEAEQAMLNADREAEVDAIVADTESAIGVLFKQPAVDVLEDYLDEYEEFYAPGYWANVQSLVDLGITAIYEATQPEDVEATLAQTLELIDVVPTLLDTYKSGAVYDMDSDIDWNAYEPAELAEVERIYSEAVTAILDVEDFVDEEAAEAEVDTIVAEALYEIGQIKTEVEKYADAQIAELRAKYNDGEAYEEIPWETMKEIFEVIDEAEALMPTANDKKDVDEIIAAAEEEIAEILPNLDDYKAEAIDALKAIVDPDDYSEAQQASIESIINLATMAIMTAEDEPGVDAAYDEAEDLLLSIPTKLRLAQMRATADLKAYVDPETLETKYDDEGKAAIADAIAEGTTAIEEAESAEAVKAALEDAEDKIDAVPTAIQNYRTNAINELYDYVDKEDYDKYGWADIQEIIDNAYDAIENEEDRDVIDGVVADAKEAIDEVPTKIESARTAAIDELEDYVDPSEYDDPTKTALEDAIADGKTEINNAETVEAIETALEAAEDEIDEIIQDAETTAEADELTAQINEAVTAYTSLDDKGAVFAAADQLLDADEEVQDKVDPVAKEKLAGKLGVINEAWATKITTAINGLNDPDKYGTYAEGEFTITDGKYYETYYAFSKVDEEYESYNDMLKDYGVYSLDNEVNEDAIALYSAVEEALEAGPQEAVEPEPQP